MTITTFDECQDEFVKLRAELCSIKAKIKDVDYLPGQVTLYTNKAKDDYHEFTEKVTKSMLDLVNDINDKMRKLIYWIVGSVLISLLLGTAGLGASQYFLYDKIHDLDKKINPYEEDEK